MEYPRSLATNHTYNSHLALVTFLHLLKMHQNLRTYRKKKLHANNPMLRILNRHSYC